MLFRSDKDLKNNRLIVEQGASSERLFTKCAFAEEPSWLIGESPVPLGKPFSCMARFRHRQPLTPVVITPEKDGVYIEFEVDQRAITPGQAVAFYKDDECLGGATINWAKK